VQTITPPVAPVADLLDLRARRAAARMRHPSTLARPSILTPQMRVSLIITVARTWDALTDLFTGPKGADQAEQCVLGLAEALVHPDARASLGAFGMPELRRLVDHLDAVERGDISHKDLEDCGSYDEALADAQANVDFAVWPLLTGRPTREACRGCRNRLPVHQWRTQVDCDDHREGRVQ
jgi:hypothetical protein